MSRLGGGYLRESGRGLYTHNELRSNLVEWTLYHVFVRQCDDGQGRKEPRRDVEVAMPWGGRHLYLKAKQEMAFNLV